MPAILARRAERMTTADGIVVLLMLAVIVASAAALHWLAL